eukprot:CAMPEP_0195609894 /NCGR_PEP_ID=MMETSP0815-20121206/9528_1 /TAXON_ID=97485 /ORGANISM="Prymnesium parvum, Strain Texoma1" /LENGTH=144 /DNA_ID=CAMNT_0040749865 /DNA_START=184 /DNA_END=615 /DNA_ORIENTATION=+
MSSCGVQTNDQIGCDSRTDLDPAIILPPDAIGVCDAGRKAQTPVTFLILVSFVWGRVAVQHRLAEHVEIHARPVILPSNSTPVHRSAAIPNPAVPTIRFVVQPRMRKPQEPREFCVMIDDIPYDGLALAAPVWGEAQLVARCEG